MKTTPTFSRWEDIPIHPDRENAVIKYRDSLILALADELRSLKSCWSTVSDPLRCDTGEARRAIPAIQARISDIESKLKNLF